MTDEEKAEAIQLLVDRVTVGPEGYKLVMALDFDRGVTTASPP